MKRFRSRSLLIALLVGLLANSAFAQGIDSAAEVLPESTAAYIEFTKPADVIDQILEHPVSKFVQEQDQFKQVLASPQFAAAFVGKAVLEQQIGEPLLDSVRTNLGDGLYLAFDAQTEGAVILFKSKDEAKLKRLAGSILNLISNQATQEGNEVPFEKETYRNAKAAEFDDFLVARYKSWFLISNKSALAKKIVDNMHDGSSRSLAKQEWFQSANRKRRSTDAWGAIDLATLRESEQAAELFSGKTNNPGVELVFGGVLDGLKHAPLAVATVELDQDLQFSISMPFNADWANESREFFFGKNLKGRGPAQLEPKQAIASLTSYRDIAGWWLSKEDLFEENVIAQLAQADSQLSNIFSGMDFGQDVLGALEPGVQIVVTENKFDEEYVPDIRLPAFALIGKLKDPEKIRRKLKIAFQSVIGFANINLGMEGQPQLDLDSETLGDTKVSSASYVYDDDTEKGLLLFNFAPTMAFQGDHVIISSSRELAVELAKLAKQTIGNCQSNTILQIDGKQLHQILKDNRESLIAQNMLEKGHDRKAAKNEIETLLTLASLLHESELDFRVEPDEMKLEFTIRTAE